MVESKRSDRWTPFTGYEDLIGWKSRQFTWLNEIARGKPLADAMSSYSITVLRDCIERTALSSLCAAYVRVRLPKAYELAERVDPPIDLEREKTTICAYLDGIAARAGKPLGKRIAPVPGK